MKEYITDDGSVTFYNETVKDYCHTKSGAKEEAIEKYTKSLGVKPNSIIFDICFGIGYNSAAALDVGPQTIYCFENDKEILEKILSLDTDFKSYKTIKEFVNGFFNGNLVYEKNGNKLIMVFGDARKEIKNIKQKADYVFFAPFSPSKVPELWTEQFFSNIKDKMKPKAKLATYSCAVWVRNNMKNAGFNVEDGPVVGRISPSTIAIN